MNMLLSQQKHVSCSMTFSVILMWSFISMMLLSFSCTTVHSNEIDEYEYIDLPKQDALLRLFDLQEAALNADDIEAGEREKRRRFVVGGSRLKKSFEAGGSHHGVNKRRRFVVGGNRLKRAPLGKRRRFVVGGNRL